MHLKVAEGPKLVFDQMETPITDIMDSSGIFGVTDMFINLPMIALKHLFCFQLSVWHRWKTL
jgi:hypothetical protein